MERRMQKPHERKAFDKDRSSTDGRIGRLDEQTLGYYRRVEQALDEGFENEDDKSLFLDNVFKELSVEAVEISRNQTASRIVEHLVRESCSSKHLTLLGEAFSKDWEIVITDRFASYVTQALVERLGQFTGTDHNSAGDSDDGDPTRMTPSSLLIGVYTFFMPSLAFYMQHTYATHILRTLMETLVGVKVSEKVIRSQTSRQSTRKKWESSETVKQVYQQNTNFLRLFEEMCDTILSLPKLEDHARNVLANPVLQTMILVSQSCPNLRDRLCQTLIERTEMFLTKPSDSDTQERIPPPALVGHNIGSHLVGQVLASVSEAHFGQILEDHMSGKLLSWATHPVANFVVQSVIRHMHTKAQFCAIYGELEDNLEDIITSGRAGIIVSLTEACMKHGALQEKLLKALMEAFQCYKPIERQMKAFPLFASFTTYDVFYRVKELDDSESEDEGEDEKKPLDSLKVPLLREVSLHGSLMLQKLLQFGNPKTLVTSLLGMKPTELKTLACHPCGSHVMDVLMESATIGEKSRDVIYQRLKPYYLDLVNCKIGSRSLDAMWKAASLKNKFVLAEALAPHEARLRHHPFGRFSWHKMALGHFVRRNAEWKQIQSGNIKKRKLFQDIVSDKGSKKMKEATEGDDTDSDEAINMAEQDSSNETVVPTTPEAARHKGTDEGQGHSRDEGVFSEETDARSKKSVKKKKKLESFEEQSRDVISKPCKKKTKHKRKKEGR